MANVIKDIGEIWTRLFDHRPFLNGEIKFFLQEFEEKRGDREVERLFETLQNLTEIRYTQIDKAKPDKEINLQTLKKKIDENILMCNSILEREGTYQANSNIKKNIELRKAEYESFVKLAVQKCAKIDELFNEEEEKLLKYYRDLEEQSHSS